MQPVGRFRQLRMNWVNRLAQGRIAQNRASSGLTHLGSFGSIDGHSLDNRSRRWLVDSKPRNKYERGSLISKNTEREYRNVCAGESLQTNNTEIDAYGDNQLRFGVP